jgi:hypothetical protein
MWILKNLVNLKAQHFSQKNSIKSYDFSTIYTTILHEKLESIQFDINDNCFYNKNGEKKYSCLVIGHQKHFVNYHFDSTRKYSVVEIKEMFEFLIDNIFVVVGGQVFQQSVGIPMSTNCAPLLADRVLHLFEAGIIQTLLFDKKNYLATSFRFEAVY